MKVSVNALTEKGQIKPAVRTKVAAFVDSNRELFAEATKIEGKNSYVLPVLDAEGNTFYVNFDVTISNKSAADRVERKSTPKRAAEPETIDIE